MHGGQPYFLTSLVILPHPFDTHSRRIRKKNMTVLQSNISLNLGYKGWRNTMLYGILGLPVTVGQRSVLINNQIFLV